MMEAVILIICDHLFWFFLTPPKGSSGDFSPVPRSAVDDDLELFLTRGLSGGTAAMTERLAKTFEQLSPQRLADYHRRLARIAVAKLRRDLRQRLGVLQRNLERG